MKDRGSQGHEQESSQHRVEVVNVAGRKESGVRKGGTVAWADDADDGSIEEPPVRAWTREEVAALRRQQPGTPLSRFVLVQAVVGLVCAALWGLFTGRSEPAVSALCGAGVAVLPQALFAIGLHRQAGAPATAAAVGFFVWELAKIATALVLLGLVVWLVPGLHWPALLITMVVCLKANGLVLLRRGRM
jgi:ATP synthase protein I